MTNSSILGGERAATPAAGRDTDALGPSNTSDSGSDIQGERPMATGVDSPDEFGALPVELGSDSDAFGTGERGAADGAEVADGADISPDHIEAGPELTDALDTDTVGDDEIDTLAADDDADDDETGDDDDDVDTIGDPEGDV